MQGESDLSVLLANLQPQLHKMAYVFVSVDRETYDRLTFDPLGIFFEEEGITVILTEEQASELGISVEATWACITLGVHSSLAAVGFLAVVIDGLAQAGISVNPVSAFYHDQLFVPWESRRRVINLLRKLSKPG